MLRRFLTASFLIIISSTAMAQSLDLLAKIQAGSKLWPEKISSAQQDRLSGRDAPDNINAIVMMCDFPDNKFFGNWINEHDPRNPGDFYFTAHDSLYYHHQIMDVATYFSEVSNNQFELNYDICGTVATMPNNMEWYGNHPEEGEQRFLLARDAVEILDDVIDFSNYDTVFLIHSDAGEETDVNGDSPEQVYSSYLGVDDFEVAFADTILTQPFIETADDAIVNRVLILPEYEYQDFDNSYGGAMGSLGVYCFEMGQRLGMLPLFDPTPDSAGIGNYGLMGYGLFLGGGLIPAEPCAFNKVLMGWLDPIRIVPSAEEQEYELSYADNSCALVEISTSEYFLLEYKCLDPDGNSMFSFADDLNGNGIPDFYNDSLGGQVWGEVSPGVWGVLEPFDPEYDTRETLIGSEFDFFMSDNPDPSHVKGAGSGIYIWHIDEWVIQNVASYGSSSFNGNADRKAVDLEEADSIQDLDSMQGSFVLGCDFDSFRAENNSAFTPETLPNTDSSSGAKTGIVINQISPAVASVDTFIFEEYPGEEFYLYNYHDTMTFNCSLERLENSPELIADLLLPEINLSGSDLLACDLNDDDLMEIVTAGSGSVFVFDSAGELILTIEATDSAGDPVSWNGSPAVGDIDDDGMPEIVLTSVDGVYAFNPDGSEVADGDLNPESFGFLYELENCILPPLLVPDSSDDAIFSTAQAICVADQNSIQSIASSGQIWSLAVTDSIAAVPPILWHGFVVLPVVGADQESKLILHRQAESYEVLLPEFVSGFSMYSDNEQLYIPLIDGGLATIQIDNLETASVWDSQSEIHSTVVPGLYFCSDNGFASTGVAGYLNLGWPVGEAGAGVTPLVCSNAAGEDQIFFTSSDGKLYLYDESGNLIDGWPLVGPGTPAGGGLLVDIDNDSQVELVVAGATSRLSESTDGVYSGSPTSRIMIYKLDDSEQWQTVWPMAGGNPERHYYGLQQPSSGTSGVVDQSTIVCYPSPLTTGTLFVRVDSSGECSFQAVLYNLEGEEVARSDKREVAGAEPVEVELIVDHIAAGMYVCKITASNGIDTEIVTKPVAVIR